MSILSEAASGDRHLLMGNQAIARGALEAGVSVAAGSIDPGTQRSMLKNKINDKNKDRIQGWPEKIEQTKHANLYVGTVSTEGKTKRSLNEPSKQLRSILEEWGYIQ